MLTHAQAKGGPEATGSNEYTYSNHPVPAKIIINRPKVGSNRREEELTHARRPKVPATAMSDSSVSMPIMHKSTTIGHVLRRMDNGTIDGYDGGADGKWSLWAEYRTVQKPHEVELRRGFYKYCEDVKGKFDVELLAIAVSEGGFRTFIVRKMAQDDPLRKPFCAGLVNQSGGLTIKASSRVAGVEAEPPNTLLLGSFLSSKSVAQHKRARVTIRVAHGVSRQEGQGEKAAVTMGALSS